MGEFITPGKLLGTEEEFVCGECVYGDEGKLHALCTGEVSVDKQKVVSVKPSNAIPKMVGPGMVVYGRVEDIFEPIALVKLEPLEAQGARQTQGDYLSVLHVSNIRRDYVESLRSEVRVGDVIKAVVSEIRRGEVYLDIRGADLGVVKAYCSRCRNPLYLRDRALVCKNCGNRENRKLCKEYSAIER
ncbi:MAG: exosome complex RNA-binding protein Csl4 [Candidatus Micrarchaeota archaeon]|nr:exosome complex RNA-binding protein Csl4 [Candidatus Micrarchaeota archaeon]